VLAIGDRKALRLTVMTALYIAQGIPYGFVTVTLAAYLAKHGATEAEVGNLGALALLPWSFKFLWGPLVDRFSHSAMGRRRPWIISAQVMLVTGMASLLLIPEPEKHIELIGMIVVGSNIFASLQDVSVDALAVDLLPESERGFANGLMYGGSYLGTMFGGAMLSTVLGTYGLEAALIGQILGLGVIALLPIFLRERTTDKLYSLKTRPRPADAPPRTSLFKRLIRAFSRRSPLLAAVLSITILLGSQTITAMFTVLLVKKLGWTEAEFGQMQGGWPLLFGLGGSVVGGWLADKLGHKKMVAAASALLGGTWLAFGLLSSQWTDRDFILAYVCVQELCLGTLSASLFAFLMGVSWPAVAASQFTAYMALLNLGRALGSKLTGPFSDTFGTAGSYLVLGVWQFVVLGLLLLIDPKQNRRELGEGEG
jgi:MFS transporter, PAT family, beta-lactamase induction signal transducer AmpG